MAIPGNANLLLLTEAAGAAPTEYTIDRSLRFNSGDSAYLSRTFSAGNQTTWTWSGWVKRSSFDTTNNFFVAGTSAFANIRFANQNIDFTAYNGSSYIGRKITSAVYRDPSAWYHIVCVFDTSNATAGDRMRVYVNGVREESFSTSTDPTQNATSVVNSNVEHRVGTFDGSTEFFNGYLADVHFIDGQALAATDFGEFDTNNVWQPIEYTGSFGTNGFHLDFSDATSTTTIAEDSSGNNNDWTANNIALGSGLTLPGVEFNDTTDYLQLDNSNLALGSGDFTVEAYVNIDKNADDDNIFSYRGAGASATGFNFVVLSSNRQLAAYSNGFIINGGNVPEGKWVHVAISRSSGTVRGFIEGVQFGSTTDTTNFTNTKLSIGHGNDGSQGPLKGKISNFRLVVGSALYTSNFTPPTTPLSNVTNTKLLCCQSNSSATAAAVSPATLGSSGTPTAGDWSDNFAGDDSLFDSPTNANAASDTGAGGEVSGNYCTWNPLNSRNASGSFTNGNLEASLNDSAGAYALGSIAISSGKWYWEGETTSNTNQGHGICLVPFSGSSRPYQTTSGYVYLKTGQKWNNGSGASYGDSFTTGDIIGVALDMDAGTLTFYKNGVSQGVAYTGLSGTFAPHFADLDAGTTHTSVYNFGQRPFAYTAPTGYQPLTTALLDDPTIADGSTAMDVALYTGNGGTQSITTINHSPDFVWIKERSGTDYHMLFDVVRGANVRLNSNSTNNDYTESNALTSFDTNGFTTGDNFQTNVLNETYVAWCWDGGSSTVSNTDGSITSSVRANATAGFSIVGYTGAGSAATVGHGLGVTPSLVICKDRTAADAWMVWFTGFTSNEYMYLNSTDAKGSYSGTWGSTPTSTVFGVSDQSMNQSGNDFIAYCFAPVEGYSAFGSYTGTSGQNFVHLGFRPKLLIIKNSSNSSFPAYTGWAMFDSSRSTYNVNTNALWANSSQQEGLRGNGGTVTTADFALDMLSNGFCLRDNGASEINLSGNTYIYAAFAENPFKYARAR